MTMPGATFDLNSIVRTELHAHTINSDGGVSPEQLVELAERQQVQLLALTDHDTVGGIERAQKAAAAAGIVFLPGVEMSTHWQGNSVHLLGYFPASWSLHSEAGGHLQVWLQELRRHREARNRKLAEKFAAHGIRLDLEALATAVGSGKTVDQLGRPHIARWLVEHGYALSIADAFGRFLTPGAPTYVQLDGVPTVEAIAQIRRFGGFTSLAHPVRLKIGLDAILPELVHAGLQGIEVFYPNHTPEQQAAYRLKGEKFGLTLTGGSDFHARPGEVVGSVAIPAGVIQNWNFCHGIAAEASIRG